MKVKKWKLLSKLYLAVKPKIKVMNKEQNNHLERGKTTILQHEVVKEPENMPAFPSPGELADLAISKNLLSLAERIHEIPDLINYGSILSPKTPWIKGVAYVEVGRGDFDYEGLGVNVVSHISNDDTAKNSKYVFTPITDYSDSGLAAYSSSGSITIKFCNTVFLYNAVVFIRVSVYAGSYWREPRNASEGFDYIKVPHNIEHLNFKLWRNGEHQATIQCTGEPQVISIHMGELVWPGETLVLLLDDTYFQNWTFYDAKIMEFD